MPRTTSVRLTLATAAAASVLAASGCGYDEAADTGTTIDPSAEQDSGSEAD